MRRPFSPHCPEVKPAYRSSYIMKAAEPKATAKQELVGIVISGMPTPPQTTVFTAYIWGPAPTITDEETKAG